MKIIEPSFNLQSGPMTLTPGVGVELIRWVEYNARISHRSEDAWTDTSYIPFITAHVLGHGDWSVTEHAHVTAIIRTDRGITHEIVRHRLFSFTQESTRFVNSKNFYKEGLEFIMPSGLTDDKAPATIKAARAFRDAEDSYLGMLAWGAKPQEARAVLPNALASTISMTGNLRSWRHFLLMRTTKESHPDMRRITIPMLEEFKKCIPLLYDDIEPNARQIDNERKPQ